MFIVSLSIVSVVQECQAPQERHLPHFAPPELRQSHFSNNLSTLWRKVEAGRLRLLSEKCRYHFE
ncbi:MAG: hypothetical protein ACRD4L_04460, partial [Pyrinomonadaceae bacterium]